MSTLLQLTVLVVFRKGNWIGQEVTLLFINLFQDESIGSLSFLAHSNREANPKSLCVCVCLTQCFLRLRFREKVEMLYVQDSEEADNFLKCICVFGHNIESERVIL